MKVTKLVLFNFGPLTYLGAIAPGPLWKVLNSY